jgi:hypothetical protein
MSHLPVPSSPPMADPVRGMTERLPGLWRLLGLLGLVPLIVSPWTGVA